MTHCTRTRFTVVVSCSDELARHSRPLICLQGQVAKVFCVDFYCVATTWQQISKDLLQFTVVDVFSFFEVRLWNWRAWLFSNPKNPDKISLFWRFSVGKDWPWKRIIRAAYSTLQICSDEGLWPCRMWTSSV